MAGFKLQATVHVDGSVYAAGTSVPREIAERITNPKAWGGDVPSFGKATTSQESSGDADSSSGPKEPPREGRGSGDKAWQAYAAEIGLEVPEGAKKDDIIAKLDEVRAAEAANGSQSTDTGDQES